MSKKSRINPIDPKLAFKLDSETADQLPLAVLRDQCEYHHPDCACNYCLELDVRTKKEEE